jgi:hypothetical protein
MGLLIKERGGTDRGIRRRLKCRLWSALRLGFIPHQALDGIDECRIEIAFVLANELEGGSWVAQKGSKTPCQLDPHKRHNDGPKPENYHACVGIDAFLFAGELQHAYDLQNAK